MDLKQKVLEFRSVRDKDVVLKYFIDNPDKIKGLVDLITDLTEYPYKEYASWLLIHIAKSRRFDLDKYADALTDVLFKTKNQTVLRNVTCVLSHLRITGYRESEMINLLLKFVSDYENKVALQVYSIYILAQYTQKYPELKPEIIEIIDLHSKEKTVAYHVARRNFITRTKNI